MRLIDADELIKVFKYSEDADYSKWTLQGVISEINDAPTVCDIDAIRAEIAALDKDCHVVYAIAIDDVLQIIDSHMRESRNDREEDYM